MQAAYLFKKLTAVAVRIFMRRHPVTQFEIVVYKNQMKNSVITYETTGYGTEWQESTSIYLPGFNNNSVINLQNEWHYVLNNHLNEYQTNISLYETVRKFDEVIQLKTDYEIYFKVQYKHE
ncbi:hypothetical protein [Psychromonas ossibalaenae]|uniref:hypothetical protein n=1 Tax=Psychromonas ossibalaenae TaxID=444922 RepID=UPI00037AF31F|nr:hypothetical protein [Psychromonas ossibalaenae]